jgi:hypothetical protein
MGNAAMWARAGVGRLMVLAVNGEIRYRLVFAQVILEGFFASSPDEH